MSMLGALYSSVETFLADTQFGHARIKGFATTKINELSNLIDEQTKELEKIESVQADEELKEILDNLADASQELLTDLKKDQNLEPIAAILAGRISANGGVEGFKQKLLDTKSAKELKEYAGELVDIKNYKALVKLVTDLESYPTLNKRQQEALAKKIESGDLVDKIQAENDNLKPNNVKARVKTLVTQLCKDLDLNKEQQTSLISIFDRVVDKHLKEFNPIRKQLVKKLPVFLKAELERFAETKTTEKETGKGKGKGKVEAKDSDSEDYDIEIDTKKAITPSRHLGRAKGGVKREGVAHEADLDSKHKGPRRK